MVADLHAHTKRSDGLLEPAELVAAAQAKGLHALAITDHDSVAGIEAARAAAAERGVELVAGVELSIRDVDPTSGHTTDHHLLGWFVDPSATALLSFLDRLQEERRSTARLTLALLDQMGLPVDPARVAQLAAGAVVTRPHIARALVEAGHVTSEREAFERFLGSGRPAALERPSPSATDAIGAIRGAGGVAGLAHPVFSQDPGWRERLVTLPAQLDRMAAAGLRAVECAYPDATPAIAEQLTAWARERGLVRTGGSDYHGPGCAPYVELGHSAVTQAVVEALRASA